MMAKRYTVTVQHQRDGAVLVTCEVPVCMSRARDEQTALARIRDEIRYRIELCPCSGVDDDYVQLEIKRR